MSTVPATPAAAKAETPAAAPSPVALPTLLVDLAKIRESPFQPRLVYHPGEMDELRDSIRQRGVLQPVKLRPVAKDNKGTEYELVWGHRRHRASVAAGLKQIPSMVATMSDEEVCNEQLIENHQRKDIHPLEEADQFRLLHEKFKRPAEEIGKRIGLSKEYVYARMKLCALGKPGREAFLAGKLTVSTALLLARISDPKRQADAVKDATDDNRGDGPMQARQLSRHLQQNYLLRLAQAPFDVKDALLVKEAGACTTCPKNSAAERALFTDVDPKGGDLCTDGKCYQGKCDVDFDRKAKDAARTGAKVLPDDKAKKLFYPNQSGLQYGSPYVKADDVCHQDPKGRTYKALLKSLPEMPVTLARDSGRQVHELLEEKALPALLKKAGHSFAERTRTHGVNSDAIKAEEKRRRDQQERVRMINAAGIAALVAKVEAGGNDDKWVRVLLASLLQHWSISDGLADAVKRRGLAEKGKRPEAIVKSLVPRMTGAQMRGWLTEIILCRFGLKSSFQNSIGEACKVYGLDHKALGAQALKTKKDEKAAKSKPAAKAKSKPATSPAVKKPAPNGKPAKASGK
jgi:ParB/RepB/Spo0J family partition protein